MTIERTQRETRLKLTEEFINRQLNFYESPDFRGMYAVMLFEDSHGVQYQIKQVCEREFNLKINNTQAEQIYQHMLENLDEYTSEFSSYYVGSYSVDSIEYGEQETEMPTNFLPVVSELENQFTINRRYLYYNFSGRGLHVSLNKKIVETVLNIKIDE